MYLIQILKLLFFSKTKSCGVISIQEKTVQLAKNHGKILSVYPQGQKTAITLKTRHKKLKRDIVLSTNHELFPEAVCTHATH